MGICLGGLSIGCLRQVVVLEVASWTGLIVGLKGLWKSLKKKLP